MTSSISLRVRALGGTTYVRYAVDIPLGQICVSSIPRSDPEALSLEVEHSIMRLWERFITNLGRSAAITLQTEFGEKFDVKML